MARMKSKQQITVKETVYTLLTQDHRSDIKILRVRKNTGGMIGDPEIVYSIIFEACDECKNSDSDEMNKECKKSLLSEQALGGQL